MTITTSSTPQLNLPTTTKRHKLHHDHHDHHHQQPLIPGLPDHIAQLCLSQINPSCLFSISSSWRRFIYSPSFPPFFSLYAILSPTTTLSSSNSIHFYNFDPISTTWRILPPPPLYPPLLLRHPSFLSRNLSIQSISVSGNLVLLAATTLNLYPALSRPLIFNPLSQAWTFGPTLATPRRWCALGASCSAVYVASGIGSHYSNDVAKSLEKWDLNKKTGEWESKKGLKDGRFSREAIDAVGWRGKLCMVNVKGDAAKEGVIYDVEEDLWKEMPEGMLGGWRGPVAAMAEDVMYVVDEVKGCLKKYVAEEDYWEEVMVCESLKGAEQIAAEGGRVCVVSGGKISVVDVVAAQPRLTVVDLPQGFQAVAVHILPRMPVTDFSI
ncbi:PREDICTED: F-box/kelch-repeat protein SKIP25 isoform X2 [Lupinus angustifolius]|uniref:F-box/kelch-repeat protein SKIP25 isoform X2 n=1 Tax=Lupinus angustifolius TaxID=3871 RepID=UPI00092F5E0F|nr:PREDICTED: F-box/kelch-repeat protein SKIP25 isoform X2 [Lupinus angustifolius]